MREEITTTSEDLQKMSLSEKVSQHAKDVMKTERERMIAGAEWKVVPSRLSVNSPDCGCGHIYELRKEEKCEYTYNFLFGGGSLGHPLQPSIVGESVYKVAELVGAKVMFRDFTDACFDKQITKEAIERAFFPIWGLSDDLHALPQPVSKDIINRRIKNTKHILSKIKP